MTEKPLLKSVGRKRTNGQGVETEGREYGERTRSTGKGKKQPKKTKRDWGGSKEYSRCVRHDEGHLEGNSGMIWGFRGRNSRYLKSEQESKRSRKPKHC